MVTIRASINVIIFKGGVRKALDGTGFSYLRLSRAKLEIIVTFWYAHFG
jgi:hypothetical protein